MKSNYNIVSMFPKELFWDMDINKLSIKEDKGIIIPRLVLATTKETFLKDILVVEKLYAPSLIYSTLKNTKEKISNNVCKMVCQHYSKPLFLRYKY